MPYAICHMPAKLLLDVSSCSLSAARIGTRGIGRCIGGAHSNMDAWDADALYGF
jgi:hypothetical protein